MGAWIEISFCAAQPVPVSVAPYMGAWIEIPPYRYVYYATKVAPYMGAWIEIHYHTDSCRHMDVSLPTWERGLKSLMRCVLNLPSLSLPTWERGLKSIT